MLSHFSHTPVAETAGPSDSYSKLLALHNRHKRALPTPANANTFFTPDCVISYQPTGKIFRGLLEISQLLDMQRATAFMKEKEEVLDVTVDVNKLRVVEESVLHLTHGKVIEWLLPKVQPTDKDIRVVLTTVINYSAIDGEAKVRSKRVYWDQAQVLRQVALLPTSVFNRSLGAEVTIPLAPSAIVSIENIKATLVNATPEVVEEKPAATIEIAAKEPEQQSQSEPAKPLKQVQAVPAVVDNKKVTSDLMPNSRPSIRLHNAPGGRSTFSFA